MTVSTSPRETTALRQRITSLLVRHCTQTRINEESNVAPCVGAVANGPIQLLGGFIVVTNIG
ncbi:hypothetical protein CQZ93_14645 [Ochrobactrum vermis]|nr:hypothetical protein CQZ93_14645 [Ochrobactrum vermis]